MVYGAGKTPDQVVAILRTLHERHPERAVLATRLSDEALAQVVDRRCPRLTSTRWPAR